MNIRVKIWGGQCQNSQGGEGGLQCPGGSSLQVSFVSTSANLPRPWIIPTSNLSQPWIIPAVSALSSAISNCGPPLMIAYHATSDSSQLCLNIERKSFFPLTSLSSKDPAASFSHGSFGQNELLLNRNWLNQQGTMAQALKKIGIKDLAKIMTLAPIFWSQNYFRWKYLDVTSF